MIIGQNMTPILPWRDRAIAHHPDDVPPLVRRVLSSVQMAPLEIIAFVACRGSDIGKMRISGLGHGQAKFLTWYRGNMSRQTH